MAKFDLPAIIDKVLELNGNSELYYVGHSQVRIKKLSQNNGKFQGNLVGFLALADKPQYNTKVDEVIDFHSISCLDQEVLRSNSGRSCALCEGIDSVWLLGLPNFSTNRCSKAYILNKIMNNIQLYTSLLGAQEIFSNIPWLLRLVGEIFCKNPPLNYVSATASVIIAIYLYYDLFRYARMSSRQVSGRRVLIWTLFVVMVRYNYQLECPFYHSYLIKQTRTPVYFSHFPVGSSTWTFLHYAQVRDIFALCTGLYNLYYFMKLRMRKQRKRCTSIMETRWRIFRNMAGCVYRLLFSLKYYSQFSPHPYNYSLIDTDLYLYWSRNDWLATPADIENILVPSLRSGIIKV